ncbi:hypothetical protein VB711_16880 [Cronbergia sp. UHCC 0137]|nr:hypothetical protein [Cronbergia sp. UHCC 0137]MEA5619502.1 hypothetical protein [Cronbergia sp. UHCC 0137]
MHNWSNVTDVGGYCLGCVCTICIADCEGNGVDAVVSKDVIDVLSNYCICSIAKVPIIGEVVTRVGGCGAEGADCTFLNV